MKAYIWKGEATFESVEVKDGDSVSTIDLTLVTNGDVTAPENHWLIKQWVAAGLLVEKPTESQAETGKRPRAQLSVAETPNAQE